MTGFFCILQCPQGSSVRSTFCFIIIVSLSFSYFSSLHSQPLLQRCTARSIDVSKCPQSDELTEACSILLFHMLVIFCFFSFSLHHGDHNSLKRNASSRYLLLPKDVADWTFIQSLSLSMGLCFDCISGNFQQYWRT